MSRHSNPRTPHAAAPLAWKPLLLGLGLCLAGLELTAADITVTSAGDTVTVDGAVTLREAILSINGGANVNADVVASGAYGVADRILFDISGTGVHVITLASPLPTLTVPVTIDGYSQPGSSVNTLAVGSNAVLNVAIDGAGLSGTCLTLSGGNSIVKGLYFGRCGTGGTDSAIEVDGPGGDTVAGNFIGEPWPGAASRPDGPALVSLHGNWIAILMRASNATVGGVAPGDRNVLSGNKETGLRLPALGAIVRGNNIGVDHAMNPMGNGDAGIRIQGNNNVIGSSYASYVDANQNWIAYNKWGIVVEGGTGNTMRGNLWYGNKYLAVSLGGATTPLPSDYPDVSTGPNTGINYPLIGDATAGSGTVQFPMIYFGRPLASYFFDYFASPACSARPQDFLQAPLYLTSEPISTDANGVFGGTITVSGTIQAGDRISAMVTEAAGNSSELSQRTALALTPPYGAPSGENVSLKATLLPAAGYTVTVGGSPATNVVQVDGTTLTFTTPTLLPGSVNDVVLSPPGGNPGTLPSGFVADFADIAPTSPFRRFINLMAANRVTGGCGSGNYCPNSSTTRGQMAVFLIQSLLGQCPFPYTGTPYFTDVPGTHPFFKWVQKMRDLGVTGGCSATTYCPDNPVTRGQMAVFVIRGLLGTSNFAYPMTPYFTDVPSSHPFFKYVQKMRELNITGGCSATQYCPDSPNTRAQMSVFLTQAFFP